VSKNEKTLPAPDQIEVSVFGPGFGECIAVHLGDGRWIIVDSCINREIKRPAVLTYFSEIAVDPKTAVDLILATHWDDDHVAGIDDVVEACENADVWFSDALQCEEFLELLDLRLTRPDLKFTRGTSHIGRVVDLKGPAIKFAMSDMRILQRKLALGGNDIAVEAWTLSPSHYENYIAKQRIGALIPRGRAPEPRILSRRRNHGSVVLAVIVGGSHILLGADLEEPGDPRLGWSAVVASTGRPHLNPKVFKVPHHGSITGHHPDTWKQLVAQSPVTATTPYSWGGRSLPTPQDVDRITTLSGSAFVSRRRVHQAPIKRNFKLDQLAKSTTVSWRRIAKVPGHIRMRHTIGADEDAWEIALFDGADVLQQFQAA